LFHNKLVDKYANDGHDDLFGYVKKQVIWYYQWIVVNDYLPKLIDNNILEKILTEGTTFYNAKKYKNALPLEFTVSAFRYGHFTVRNNYKIAEDLCVDQTQLHELTKGNLPKYIIDWRNFFSIADECPPQPSKSIDTEMSFHLENMKHIKKPDDLNSDTNSLLFRNLLRSSQLKIASGQNIAKFMCLPPIARETMSKYDRDSLLEKNCMLDHTPLLIYILKESEIFTNGQYLTGVGGILVAETFLSLLFEDTNSYFNSKEKWYPTLPSKYDSQFFMGDLIKFVYS